MKKIFFVQVLSCLFAFLIFSGVFSIMYAQTVTPSDTPSDTPTPTVTLSPTQTLTPTVTMTPTATNTPAPGPTATPTPAPAPTNTPTITPLPTSLTLTPPASQGPPENGASQAVLGDQVTPGSSEVPIPTLGMGKDGTLSDGKNKPSFFKPLFITFALIGGIAGSVGIVLWMKKKYEANTVKKTSS